MDYLFDDAYFGKLYKTRNGLKAIFINQNKLGRVTYICQPKGSIYAERTVNRYGLTCDGSIDSNDIISEWHED